MKLSFEEVRLDNEAYILIRNDGHCFAHVRVPKEGSSDWRIFLAERLEVSSILIKEFSWIGIKKKFKSEAEAKEFVERYWPSIQKMNLYYFD